MSIKQLNRRSKPITIFAALPLCLAIHQVCAGELDKKISFDIKSQSLDTALLMLSEQSNTQLIMDSSALGNINSKGLIGSMTVEKALSGLLKGTGLTYSFQGDTVKIITDDKEGGTGNEDVKEVDEIVVTGSRIRSNAQPTSYLEVITRDEFEKLGLNSAEDIVRYLPQNFSSVNSGSTTTGQGNRATPHGSLGQSSANLRGLGSSATLVLVNGRRIAGSPTYKGDGTINLSTIPAAAIERVEVLLEGASAIYGSDALGGVINFVLRKDWAGAKTTVRYENSANDGDVRYLSQVLGSAWETGSATLTLSYQESDSVNAHKAGFDSWDFTSKGGSDYRIHPVSSFGWPASFLPSQPGYVVSLGSLQEGFTGSDWTIADLSFDNLKPYDSAAVEGVVGTSTSKETSVSLNFEQGLGDSSAVLFGDLLYSKRNNQTFTNIATTDSFGPAIGATNPYNNLGFSVTVDYLFGDEPLPAMNNRVDLKRINANLGVKFDLSDSWQMSVVGSFGTEESDSFATKLGGAAYLSALAGIEVDEDGDPVLDGGGNAIPVPAINYFTGEHDADVNWASFIVPDPSNGSTTNKNESLEVSANGPLLSTPSGDVMVALGAQLRKESYDLTDNLALQQQTNLSGLNLSGSDPLLERDVQAVFFETSIPVIDGEKALPGIRQLLFTVAGRWEEYTMERKFNGPSSPREEKVFKEFSPKVGFMWQPFDDLRVRASWSESFRAPSLLSLAEPARRVTSMSFVDIDHPDFPGQEVVTQVELYRGGNPNLQPETATTISTGIEWTPSSLDGLTISATYTKIDWESKIKTLSIFDTRVASNTERYPDSFVRGSDGYLDAVFLRSVNTAQSLTEVVDFNTRYEFSTELGDFHLGLAAVYTLKANEALLEGEAPIELVATDYGPDELVLRGSVGWSRGSYGINVLANYSSSYDFTEFGYRQLIGEKNDYIEHYSTIDLTGFYNFNEGWEFKAGIRNLLNNKFPFVDHVRSPYDPQRVDVRGRVIYLDVSRSFDF